MRHRKRPLFKQNELDTAQNGNGLFSIIAIIPQILICAIVFGAYYYINSKGMFSLWMNYITYGVKFIIALEIIVAAAKSLTGPLLAIALGALSLYFLRTQGLELISPNDAVQLMIMGGIGIIITFIVRSLKR